MLLGSIPFVSHNANATAPTITKYGIITTQTGAPTGEAGSAIFIFFLTYTDADNDSPSAGYPKANKYVPPTQYTYPAFQFLANDTLDTDYTDGKAYYYSWSYFPVLGQMFWSFRVKSGADAEVTKIMISMTQNFPATILPIKVYPNNNEPGEKVFTVNYTNLYATSPYSIQLNVDGTNYSMVKNDTGDTSYWDGCNYYYELNLTAGLHNYTIYWRLFASYPLHSSGMSWLLLEDPPDFQISIGTILIVGLIGFFLVIIWVSRR